MPSAALKIDPKDALAVAGGSNDEIAVGIRAQAWMSMYGTSPFLYLDLRALVLVTGRSNSANAEALLRRFARAGLLRWARDAGEPAVWRVEVSDLWLSSMISTVGA